jgi:hypothetical protein
MELQSGAVKQQQSGLGRSGVRLRERLGVLVAGGVRGWPHELRHRALRAAAAGA